MMNFSARTIFRAICLSLATCLSRGSSPRGRKFEREMRQKSEYLHIQIKPTRNILRQVFN